MTLYGMPPWFKGPGLYCPQHHLCCEYQEGTTKVAYCRSCDQHWRVDRPGQRPLFEQEAAQHAKRRGCENPECPECRAAVTRRWRALSQPED